jgi:hypothetical protein
VFQYILPFEFASRALEYCNLAEPARAEIYQVGFIVICLCGRMRTRLAIWKALKWHMSFSGEGVHHCAQQHGPRFPDLCVIATDFSLDTVKGKNAMPSKNAMPRGPVYKWYWLQD